MKLVTYRDDRGDRAGVLTAPGRVLDAADALGEQDLTVRSLIAAQRLAELESATGSSGASGGGNSVDEVELLAPLGDPEKIICIGLNYHAHAEEAGLEPPAVPTFFAKFRNALAAPGADVALPAASAKVDYEAEIAFVLGRRCHEIAPEDAVEAIAGYMLFNDLSARDLQFATNQWMPGKVFDGSAPSGPALVTPDEAGDHDAISFGLTLNGETMQSGSTDDLIFSVPELISHLSNWMTLEPGDIVSTGTPAGVGSLRKPRIWLKPGDLVEISSPTLGTLATTLT